MDLITNQRRGLSIGCSKVHHRFMPNNQQINFGAETSAVV